LDLPADPSRLVRAQRPLLWIFSHDVACMALRIACPAGNACGKVRAALAA
jgi:hypothetical protein